MGAGTITLTTITLSTHTSHTQLAHTTHTHTHIHPPTDYYTEVRNLR